MKINLYIENIENKENIDPLDLKAGSSASLKTECRRDYHYVVYLLNLLESTDQAEVFLHTLRKEEQSLFLARISSWRFLEFPSMRNTKERAVYDHLWSVGKNWESIPGKEGTYHGFLSKLLEANPLSAMYFTYGLRELQKYLPQDKQNFSEIVALDELLTFAERLAIAYTDPKLRVRSIEDGREIYSLLKSKPKWQKLFLESLDPEQASSVTLPAVQVCMLSYNSPGVDQRIANFFHENKKVNLGDFYDRKIRAQCKINNLSDKETNAMILFIKIKMRTINELVKSGPFHLIRGFSHRVLPRSLYIQRLETIEFRIVSETETENSHLESPD